MKRKNSEKKVDILDSYMGYVLEHGQRPKTMYAFAKHLGIKESDIYDQFGSFDMIEKSVFKVFYEHTTSLLTANDEFQNFDAKNKLLSFYFTFFEILKVNRSYVVFAMNADKGRLKRLSVLSELKTSFYAFVEELNIETLDFKHPRIEKLQRQGLAEGTWAQLLLTLQFWLDDESAGFTKTDVFIEKSITTAFALIDNDTVKSVFDLGRFLVKERLKV